MNRYRGLRQVIAAFLLGLSLILAGCSLIKQEKSSQPIDPPQVLEGDELAWVSEETSAQPEDSGSGELNTSVTVYLRDENGFIVPVSLRVAEEIGIAKKTMQYLVKGGEYERLLPQGFHPVLPEGTSIDLDIKQDQKLAVVDFSKEFKNYKDEEERGILEAVVWTLTGFPTVDQVELRVQGEKLTEMPVAGTPIDGPLTRAVGINLELPAGVDLGQSTPVTLYFSASSPENLSYYVPVTRFVQRTDNPVMAAMNELIAGPLDDTVLSGVMMPEAEVLDVSVKDNLVTVKLNDKVLDANNKVPAEMLTSIVLSLTETAGADQVHIQVDGVSAVTSTDNADFSQPVGRPAHPNMIKM